MEKSPSVDQETVQLAIRPLISLLGDHRTLSLQIIKVSFFCSLSVKEFNFFTTTIAVLIVCMTMNVSMTVFSRNDLQTQFVHFEVLWVRVRFISAMYMYVAAQLLHSGPYTTLLCRFFSTKK